MQCHHRTHHHAIRAEGASAAAPGIENSINIQFVNQTGPRGEPQAFVAQPTRRWSDIPYNWQTLEAGLLAICAALIGAYFLHRQTQQADRHKREAEQRRFRAQRATLPLALDALSTYADDCLTALRTALNGKAPFSMTPKPAPKVPPLPREAIATLERLLESCPPELEGPIADLIGEAQIVSARLEGDHLVGLPMPPTLMAVHWPSRILDTAALAARIAPLFPYSRRRTKTIPTSPSWADVRQSLSVSGFAPEVDESVYDLVSKREAKGEQPGNLWREGFPVDEK